MLECKECRKDEQCVGNASNRNFPHNLLDYGCKFYVVLELLAIYFKQKIDKIHINKLLY